MDYHVAINGVQSGPYSEAEVRLKLESGELKPGDLCWRAGWADWQAVAVAFPPASPDAPPPMPLAPSPSVYRLNEPAVGAPSVCGVAITSMVLGIVGILASVFTAVPAIICGHVARSRIRRADGGLTGAGFALAGLILGYLELIWFVVIVASIVGPTVGRVHETAERSVAASNLRQIGQASLIFASDNGEKLPSAPDVWTYAAELARGGGLNDATIWLAGSDAKSPLAQSLSTVLASDRVTVKSDFRLAQLSYAVPLGGIDVNMPSTTPIAWTRGLRSDGTWAKDSPYAGEGGHIVFMGGNVQFYRNLASDPLPRFDGVGTTTNIREALPPGVVLSEP